MKQARAVPKRRPENASCSEFICNILHIWYPSNIIDKHWFMASLEVLWFPFRTLPEKAGKLVPNDFRKRKMLWKNIVWRIHEQINEVHTTKFAKELEADDLAVDLNKLPCSNLLTSPFSSGLRVFSKPGKDLKLASK